jgi:SAM-dependent methyltransferase
MNNSKDMPEYFGRDLEAMSFAVNYHRWIIEEFKPFLGASVAEVGAGTGNFTQMLLEHTKNIDCFEPSENMFPRLVKTVGDNSKISTYQSYFGDAQNLQSKTYDSVIYVNVLEHVEDHKTELKIIRNALSANGHALIFVPALSWLFSDLDRQVGHFRRYHKKPLSELVKDAGLEIVTIKYFDFAGILPWYIAFVLMGKSISGGNVNAYDRLVVPIMKRLENIIEAPIGKNLLLVAKKA